jgi:hypothetical protein
VACVQRSHIFNGVLIISMERYLQGGCVLGARLDMFKVIINRTIWGYGLNSYGPPATEISKNTPGMNYEAGL